MVLKKKIEFCVNGTGTYEVPPFAIKISQQLSFACEITFDDPLESTYFEECEKK